MKVSSSILSSCQNFATSLTHFGMTNSASSANISVDAKNPTVKTAITVIIRIFIVNHSLVF